MIRGDKTDRRINTQGMPMTCVHCGYSWKYSGDKAQTSCPKCLWRNSTGFPTQTQIHAGNVAPQQEKKYW